MFANLITLVVVGELMGLPVTHDDGDGVGVATQPFNYTIWAQDKPRKAPATRTAKPKVAKGQWEPQSKRVRAGSVWAEATAKPQRMTIETGDGRTVTCHGPGTAFDPGRPVKAQRSTCSHLYEQASHAYRVTVSVTWGGTWRGSGGAGDALPAINRSVTFPVRIVEAQALVTKG